METDGGAAPVRDRALVLELGLGLAAAVFLPVETAIARNLDGEPVR